MFVLVSRIQPISPHVCGVAEAMSKCSTYIFAATPVCWNCGLTPRKPTRTRSIVRPLRRKCHQPSGSRRPFILASTWLTSGTVIATAAVSPSAVSATMNQFWSKTSCSSCV